MLTRLLTLLPLLLCPLLMLACMWAMRNRQTPQRQAGQQEPPTAARVTQLERELADLRGRLPQADTLAADAPHTSPTSRQAPATAHRCSRVDRPAMIPGSASPAGAAG